MCIQCRKLQKCLLMQAQTPSPLNSCVSCLSSAPLHITVDMHVLRTHSDTHFSPNISAKSIKLSNNIDLHHMQRFKNITKHFWVSLHRNPHTHTHVIKSTLQGCSSKTLSNHKSATCVCSGWRPKWESMLRQDQSASGSVSIYVSTCHF